MIPRLHQLLAASYLTVSALCIAAAPTAADSPPDEGSLPYFSDVTDAAGVDFVHWTGATGSFFFPEINGAGAALFDMDGDGDLDLYLAQGALLGADAGTEDALAPPPVRPGGRLYRHEGTGDDGVPRFADVTEESGIDARGYGMTVTAADFDDDGHVDLYLGNYGRNQMWRNQGDGTFEDVTAAWNVDDRRWTAAVTAVDVDGDGRLDLYLGNYLQFELSGQKLCTTASGRRDFCHPSSFPAQADALLRNLPGTEDGAPRFVDESARSLRRLRERPALGVVAADLDGDGRLDLYVANDDEPNLLWKNGEPGDESADGGFAVFDDVALLAGAALDGRGHAEASMGVDAGDVDGDGDLDLFLAHLAGQTNTLYVNDGAGHFLDRSASSGLAAPSYPMTGFGAGFLDLENDGDLDVFVVNGAVQVIEALARAGDPYPFHQPNQLFRNRGDGTFEDVSERAGSAFAAPEVSRGAAMGDLDDDGDVDLVVVANAGRARVLLATGDPRARWRTRWIGVELLERSGRPALGALATLERDGAPPLVRRVHADGGYASSHDPRVIFGLGDGDAAPRALLVRWADGEVDRFPPPAEGRYTTFRRPPVAPSAASSAVSSGVTP